VPTLREFEADQGLPCSGSISRSTRRSASVSPLKQAVRHRHRKAGGIILRFTRQFEQRA
jgi:hypothetical protein